MKRFFLAVGVVFWVAWSVFACQSGGSDAPQDELDGDEDGDADISDGDAEREREGIACDEPVKTPITRKIYEGSPGPTGLDISPGQQLAVGALVWNGGSSILCTGTLVSDRVVLASAHCLHDTGYDANPQDYRFVLGDDAADPVARFAVTDHAYHPSYEPYGMEDPAGYDIAVVILRDSVFETHPEVTPIAFNQDPMPDAWLSGWQQSVGYGTTENDAQNTLKYWIPERLASIRALSFEVDGRGIGSVCYGDSGGPSLRRTSGELRTFGTVSWGDESCRDHDHYARLDAVKDWILSFLEQNPVSCGPFDENGTCDGTILKACREGVYTQHDCRADGQTCALQEGVAVCVDDPCEGLGLVGECRDGAAFWCENGALVSRQCALCGETCGFVDHAHGIYCAVN